MDYEIANAFSDSWFKICILIGWIDDLIVLILVNSLDLNLLSNNFFIYL